MMKTRAEANAGKPNRTAIRRMVSTEAWREFRHAVEKTNNWPREDIDELIDRAIDDALREYTHKLLGDGT